MKRTISLFLALLLLLSGCAVNNAVNPLFGICLMFDDSLYICSRAVADSELPEGLESVGSIKDFGSTLPTSNFVSTSNDFGSELFQVPGETDKVYSYNSEKEQHWLYQRCSTGIMLDGWLYIADSERTEAELPGGYASAGTVAQRVDSGVPTADFEAMGIDEGSEVFTSDNNAQYIYVCLDRPGGARYLRLSKYIKAAIE